MRKILCEARWMMILVLIPVFSFAQAPDLGTAGSFSLFTRVGAFDNTGASSIIGDIGTNTGPLTGFPPGTFAGGQHIADDVSAQAATDVDAVYNYLATIACSNIIGTTLGNNQFLLPGVYCLGAASNINDDLILDAQGNPDALFIFKIDGALTTSKFAHIILINSASIKNIFWQINGEFVLEENSIFRGNVIVNGAISLMSASSFYGSAVSRAGAISLNNSFAELSEPPVLAIKLLNIKAVNNGGYNLITWNTESSDVGDIVELARSGDGRNFQSLLVLELKSGPGRFSFTDDYPLAGLNFYRLKMTDRSGNTDYSRIVTASVKTEPGFAIEAYPNPVQGMLTVKIKGTTAYQGVIFLTDIMGKELISQNCIGNSGQLDLSMLAPGIYFLKYNDRSGSMVLKILRQ